MRQCINGVPEQPNRHPPRAILAYYGGMKFVSLLMVVTLSLTGTPTYAHAAATPVDNNGDISAAQDSNCPTWLQWLCGKGK